MLMVTDDCTRLETDEAQEEGDPIIREEEIVGNYDDENNDERIYVVASQDLCRVCGKKLGHRKIPKTDKFLPAIFS